MAVTQVLDELGGTGTRAQLLRACTAREIAEAVTGGSVVRLARGRFGLPGGDAAEAAALEVSGVVSHESAAAWHGWSLKRRPELPVVPSCRW